MKVLFSFSLPFFLAHGGSQTLIEALMRELAQLGVEVEPVRWWDENQRGDILHYIGRPSTLSVRLGHQKGFKIVMTDLLDQPASRSRPRQFVQRSFNRIFGGIVPKFTGQFSWEVFQEIDAMVYSVPHEWEAAKYLFNANPERGHVIPHGLEEAALRELARSQPEGDYLISVATIDQRKNTILLAEAARMAKVPVVFLGKPYSEDDPYFLRFMELVDDQYVRYGGFVSTQEKFEYLRRARGFALLSQFESGCIAVFEAAGAGLPLLLSDRPWATKSYPEARDIHFVRIGAAAEVALVLARFYKEAHRKPGTTFPLFSWNEVARRYRTIYEELLRHPAEKRL
jgi:glycosyltransferase involved in cell wall biosynthesis